jgi:hypothetical protein
MQLPALDGLPGYRRRFKVTPTSDRVLTELEDDYHCMSVTIIHDGTHATALEPVMDRAPWTTCPGAIAMLKQTFTGVALNEFAARGEKRANCTHLHDLAVLGAAHVFDAAPLVYDILVSDAVNGIRRAELRRNGETELAWSDSDGRIVEPAEIAGLTLDKLSPWINSLDPQRQETTRLLRWGNMVANGRTMSLQHHSDMTRMPDGGCYTFQPQHKIHAKRMGEIRDFSNGAALLNE